MRPGIPLSRHAAGAAALVGAALLVSFVPPAGGVDAPTPGPASADRCSEYGAPIRRGSVPDELEELSGLAASRTHPGLFWAHNDSGNSFTLYAIDTAGRIHGRFPLQGADSIDIEDVAVGPCAEGASESCVYLGDFGDNRYRRPEGRIHRLPEPEAMDDRPRQVEVLRFRWPDGPRNAEAMVVDPRTGRVYVWTKETRSLGVVHRLDGLRPDGVGRAVVVTEIRAGEPRVGLPTGADAHPSGERILVRTYDSAWELRADGASDLETVLRADPVRVPAARQGQAEAIAYTPGGRGYLLGTEGAGGPLYEIECADAASSRSPS